MGIGKNEYGQSYGKHTISEVGHIVDPFHKGEVGIGKKYAELAYFSAISGNSGVQKGMALLLQEKVRQFTCYWHTMMYNHVTVQMHEPRDCLMSPTK